MRVNDRFSYRYINLERLSRNLTFYSSVAWDGRKKERLEIIEVLKHARMPILKMRDSLTGIEFDVSTGSSTVNKRHIDICQRAQKVYPGLKTLVLALKHFLETR